MDLYRWAVAGTAAVLMTAGGAYILRTSDAQKPHLGPPPSIVVDPSTAPAASVAPAAPGPVPPALAWQVPAEGTYLYRFDRRGADAVVYDATAVVAKVAGGYSETRDHQSAKVRRAYAANADGVQETGFVLKSKSGTNECRWDRPITVVPATAAPGQTWQATAGCDLIVGKQRSRVALESVSRIVGPRTATVGKLTVPLLRIDRTVTLRTTLAGKTSTRQSHFVDYFDTTRGLLAQSTEDATEDGPNGRITYRIVEAMLTLQPEGH
jgi:hypothetical protein